MVKMLARLTIFVSLLSCSTCLKLLDCLNSTEVNFVSCLPERTVLNRDNRHYIAKNSQFGAKIYPNFSMILISIIDLLVYWNRENATILFDDTSLVSGMQANHLMTLFQYHDIKIRSKSIQYFDIQVAKEVTDILTESYYVIVICAPNTTNHIFQLASKITTQETNQAWIVVGWTIPEGIRNSSLPRQIKITLISSNFNEITPVRKFSKSPEILLNDVYLSRMTNEWDMVTFARWTPQSGLNMLPHFLEKDKTHRMNGRLVDFRVWELLPYFSQTGNSTKDAFGYGADMINTLQGNLNFSIQYSPEGSNELYDVMPLRMVYSIFRVKLLRFLHYFEKIQVVVWSKVTRSNVSPVAHVLVFSPGTWLITLVAYTTVFSLLILTHVMHPTSPSYDHTRTMKAKLITGLKWIFSGQAFLDASENSSGLSRKWILGSGFLSLLIIFQYYNAYFMTFLIYQPIEEPFHSIQDVLNRKDYSVALLNGSFLYVRLTQYAMVNVGDTKVDMKLLARIRENPKNLPHSNMEALKLICNQTAVYLSGIAELQYLKKQNELCEISYTRIHDYYLLMPVFLYFTVKKDFPYSELFKVRLMRAYEGGLQKRSLERHFGKDDNLIRDDSNKLFEIRLRHMTTPFICLFGGYVLAQIALLTEILIRKPYKCTSRRPTWCKQTIHSNRKFGRI